MQPSLSAASRSCSAFLISTLYSSARLATLNCVSLERNESSTPERIEIVPLSTNFYHLRFSACYGIIYLLICYLEFYMEKKHYFIDLLSDVLDERKLTYKSLRTASWEKNVSKRTFCYFKGIYAEDIDEKLLNRFFSHIRFKDSGELYSDKYLKAVYSIVKAATKRAFLKGYIKSNPFEYGLARPKGKPTMNVNRNIHTLMQRISTKK